MPEYPAFPAAVIFGAAWAALLGRRRRFRTDALRCTRSLRLNILGTEHIPQTGPGVVLVNHYSRPGFFAGWIALAVSAAIPKDLVWVMTAAWTEGNTPWERIMATASVALFPHLAQVYGFIPMPPMPPRPHETATRARAVRQILAAAQQDPAPLLALAPEGMDPLDGKLMRPPPGVGRMLVKLAGYGCRFFPVGVYEQEQQLVVRFGPRTDLTAPSAQHPDEIDRQAADQVMEAIAALLPAALRGEYG